MGESGHSTFGLRDSSNFSSIKWKATLPSGQIIENEDGVDTLAVDLSSESQGLLVIEVSATSSDASKSECLTYRRKEIIVTSNVRPYFNPISFADGRDSIPVILENDIYKYEKPGMLFVQIQVLNADNCQYQPHGESKVDFNCDSELIEVLSNLDADCIQGTVILFASKNQGEIYSQTYYHYCPKDGNYCYFGPINERQSHHVCPVEVASSVSGSCGSSEGICQTGQPRDTQDTETHYQWQCVGSGGGTTDDCQDAKVTTTTIPSCPSGEHKSRTVCNNVKPSNSTCSLQSNGCYRWSCDSGYTRSGNSCVQCPSGQYTSSTACDTASPSNSTCQPQGNGCYGWSCDSGYTQSGNSCTQSCLSGQYTSSSGCNTASPSNSTCSLQGNGCYGWSCDSGYTQSGSSCVRARLPITIRHLRIPSRVGKTVENCQNNSRYNACIFSAHGQSYSTKNYGVNILDTINTFLENNSYKILIDGKQRATLVSGKWTRPYNSDPDLKNSQANLYHWLMYQKEWMELNAGTWYASNKDIKVKIEDTPYLLAVWLFSENKITFNNYTPFSKPNLYYNFYSLAFHEAGHANHSYAIGGKYTRSLNYKACSNDYGSTDYCCNTYRGCLLAIREGQAEFHGYLIDNGTTSGSRTITDRCKSTITLTSTAAEIYKNCDEGVPKGQMHTIGLLVYTTIWTQIYNHPNVNKKYIAVLFSEHLPLLEANDDFVTAGVKIVNLAKQLFDESTGARYAEIIKTIFKNRGLPLD